MQKFIRFMPKYEAINRLARLLGLPRPPVIYKLGVKRIPNTKRRKWGRNAGQFPH